MKSILQYAIYFSNVKIRKLLNLIIHFNAYKRIGIEANSDISASEKINLLSTLKKYHRSRPLGPTEAVCNVPVNSIYFGFGGKMVPCCFNRDFIYGHYPNDGIDDVIHGKARVDLQQLLKNHDFSQGCNHCRSQILAGNFQGVEARLYDMLRINKSGFPSEMVFELDNICNLECTMCNGTFSSAILKNKEKSVCSASPYGSEFISQLQPYVKHLQVAKFLGGEPFLIKRYYEIWELLISQNPDCVINLQTNGTVYNQKIEDLLKRGRFQIGVSIDSLNHRRFGEIRKNADLNQVLENLEKFIKYTQKGGSFVNISVCPMQQNWEEIPDIVNFCNHKNVFIFFNTVYNEGFSLQKLNSGTLKKVITHYKKAAITGNSYISKRNKRFYYDLVHQIEAWYKINSDLEQSFTPKWEYSPHSILLILKSKLSDEYPRFETRIQDAIADLPDKMMFSDHQKQLLDEISKEELIQSIQNESPVMLKQMMFNFIKNSSFVSE
jgi:molybdenum cofactor biosynthesis enzyme MoaA